MEAAPNYNRWQFSRIAPYLGRRICEVGAGIGNLSSYLADTGPELLLLTDTDPYYRATLEERFAGSATVVVDQLTLPDVCAPERFRRYQLDTVVALNVVEHIADDLGALRSIAGMLRPGGRAIILVPALPALFGSLDRELGHVRRYTRSGLGWRMGEAGLHVEKLFYFNLLGTLGWWFNARMRKVACIPGRQLRLFNAVVPVLRVEDHLRLPFGLSVIAIGARDV
jgi:SAM-dependent methyltransferase